MGHEVCHIRFGAWAENRRGDGERGRVSDCKDDAGEDACGRVPVHHHPLALIAKYQSSSFISMTVIVSPLATANRPLKLSIA